MAGSSGGDGGGMITGINVTPFVDVVLVLLIIFMVTARLVLQPASAVPLELPRASRGEGVQTVFAISLRADGSAYVNGRPVEGDDALRELARAEHAVHPDMATVIQADGDVPHRRVIRVMDLLSQADVTRIAFGVQVDPAQAGDAPGAGAPGGGAGP